MQKLPLTERVRTAGNLVVRTAVHLDTWMLYHGPTRAGILDAMNRFPAFFRFDEHAHRVSFIVHAAALFETKDSINLGCLARELQEAGQLPSDPAQEVRRLLGSVRDTVRGLHVIRSNAMAHRSAWLGFDEAFKKAQLTFDKLEGLMDAAFRTVNLLLEACGHGRVVPFKQPVEDAKAMLASLGSPGERLGHEERSAAEPPYHVP